MKNTVLIKLVLGLLKVLPACRVYDYNVLRVWILCAWLHFYSARVIFFRYVVLSKFFTIIRPQGSRFFVRRCVRPQICEFWEVCVSCWYITGWLFIPLSSCYDMHRFGCRNGLFRLMFWSVSCPDMDYFAVWKSLFRAAVGSPPGCGCVFPRPENCGTGFFGSLCAHRMDGGAAGVL